MSSTEHRLREALSAASRRFKAAAAGRMRAHGVHVGQNFLLDALREQGAMTTGELAQHMHVEVPTVTRMTQRMEAAGLLTRDSDPADRRRVRVGLTAKGRAAADAIPRLLDEIAAQALQDLTPAEREQLVDLLERLAANLGWPAPRQPKQ